MDEVKEPEVKKDKIQKRKLKDYDEGEVMNALRAKGVGFDTRTVGGKVSKTMHVEPGMLGIKGLGKMDFLVNQCHWHLVIRKAVYTG